MKNRQRKQKMIRRDGMLGYIFLAPSLILFTVLRPFQVLCKRLKLI